MSKWIKIKDKLPPTRQKLLVYSKKRGVYVDYVTAVDKFSKGSVTHWMKFPRKPSDAPKSKS